LLHHLATGGQELTAMREEPTGTHLPKPDVRLICSNATPLVGPTATIEFRRDLYYLLNTMYVTLPPVPEQPEDGSRSIGRPAGRGSDS
jgi:DNA-binding NtrC family response regulator